MKFPLIWGSVLIIALVAAALTLGSASWARRRAAREYYRARAELAASRSDWPGAARELRGLLELAPDSDGAWLMLADVEFRRGRLEEALRAVARVPSRSPNGAAARLLEGTLLVTAGQASRAEAVLKECLALDPASVEARHRLVFLYALELRRAELEAVLWQLHELDAARTSDLVLLSGSTFIVWNATEIVPMVAKFVESDPRDVAARVALGRYRRRQDDLDGARRVLEEACHIEPDNPEPLAGLAECLIDSDAIHEAADLLDRLRPEWQIKPRFAYLRGRVAEQQERIEDAIAAYHASVEQDPDQRDAQYRLGQLLVQSGKSSQAGPHLDRARKLAEREVLLGTLMDSRNPARYAPMIARLERELGHSRLAEVWYAEAVRLNPDDDALRAEASRVVFAPLGGEG